MSEILLKKFEEINEKIEKLQKEYEKIINVKAVDWERLAKQMAGESERKVQKAQAGAFLRLFAAANGNPRKAAEMAEKYYKDKVLFKALNESTAADGGYLVPPEYARDIIDLLTAKTIFRQAGATVLPMKGGTLNFTKKSTPSTASYVGEGQKIAVSQPTFSQVSLTWKKLAAMVPVSNDLLRDASMNEQADRLIRDDAVEQLRLKEDITFLTGDGSGGVAPVGVLNQTASGHKFVRTQAASPSTPEEIEADLKKARSLLMKANIPMSSPAWVMGIDTMTNLSLLKDSNGFKVFPTLDNATPTLLGIRVLTSSAVPEEEVYLVDFRQVIIGESDNLIIDIFKDGAYDDGSTIRSLAQYDETLIRVMARHDLLMRYDTAASIITSIDW